MSFLHDYFDGAYRIRLRKLRESVLARRPDPATATQEDIKKYGGWLQKELDFFHHGTASTLRFSVGVLENLQDKRHKLMVTTEFVNDYLLGKVTEEQIDKLLRA